MKISWIDEKGLSKHLSLDRNAGSAAANPAWEQPAIPAEKPRSPYWFVHGALQQALTPSSSQLYRLVSLQRNGVGDEDSQKSWFHYFCHSLAQSHPPEGQAQTTQAIPNENVRPNVVFGFAEFADE